MGNICVDINNCNNITSGKIIIEKNKLNIKYGMNGTGKSTIATAIELYCRKQPLTQLKPYGSDVKDIPSVSTNETLKNVLVFNEEFVNTLVFQESSLIENAFDVFIKTPDYDIRRSALYQRLKSLKVDIGDDERIIQLRNDFQSFEGKLALNVSGNKLKTNNNLKSIIKKENLFNIPTKLKKYTAFISDDSISINWIDWKTRGESFDSKNICPFCSESLKSDYVEEKQLFSATYNKADSQNLKNMLDLVTIFEKYLNPEKYQELVTCIRNDVGEDIVRSMFTAFMIQYDHIKTQLEKIIRFDSNVFRDIDIKNLDKIVESLKIRHLISDLFSSQLMEEVIDKINSQIDLLKTEVNELKKEMGLLRSIMQSSIKSCEKDINMFLKSAGIQYEITINMEDEGKSLAILQYRKNDKTYTVDRIRNHLSWGERNAFALVLFMFYAMNKESCLIVLDDPISSFDSNKKYAIIHRLFSKSSKSFYKRTVLMLTHDFEPIIDFVVVGKLPPEFVSISYIKNVNGDFDEREIDSKTDIRPIMQELLLHIKNESLNCSHRIVFLRKYYEHLGKTDRKDEYDILSSLIHGRPIATRKDYTPLSASELDNGSIKIRKFINGFEYTRFYEDFFDENRIVKCFFCESNAYLKLQLFRLLMDRVQMIKRLMNH